MGIFIIAFILVLTVIDSYFLYKTLKWVFQRKARLISMFVLAGSMLISIVVYKQFFVKMEFIQSKVYPDLYLIKNPTQEDVILQSSIREKVIELLTRQINKRDISFKKQSYTLRFYEYNKGDWGESGTVYFLEHEERRDGMTAELLEYYPEYELAKFSVPLSKAKEVEYFGVLNYYKDHKRIKTDTILNSFAKK